MSHIALILTALFLAVSAKTNAAPWDPYLGCYDTIEINEKPVQSGKKYKTKVTYGTDPLFLNIDGTRFKSLRIVIVVFKPENDNDVLAGAPYAFINAQGTTLSTAGDKFTTEFNGTVIWELDGGYFSDKFTTSFTKGSGGNVYLVADDTSFTLVPAKCPR